MSSPCVRLFAATHHHNNVMGQPDTGLDTDRPVPYDTLLTLPRSKETSMPAASRINQDLLVLALQRAFKRAHRRVPAKKRLQVLVANPKYRNKAIRVPEVRHIYQSLAQ